MITSYDLYCLGMESPTAHYLMQDLCEQLGIEYPPVPKDYVTSFVHPPIPVRQFDWSATTKDYEPDDPVGRGATESEAVTDLEQQLARAEYLEER